jgi:hypothetical protein
MDNRICHQRSICYCSLETGSCFLKLQLSMESISMLPVLT